MAADSWNPEQYERFKRERAMPAIDLMSLIEPIDAGTAVDLGCGTGELTLEFHRKYGNRRTVGIDSSGSMLSAANAFTAPGLTFIEGDIQKWVPTEKFDLVFSNAALQWCADHRKLFHRFREALTAGGQLVVQMPMNHDSVTHVLAREMEVSSEWVSILGGADSVDIPLAAEEYARLLFTLGFKRQHVSTKVYPHVLPSRADVVEWVKGTLLTRFESRLSPADYSRFLGEYREKLFARLPDDRPFFYPFKRLLLWGSLRE